MSGDGTVSASVVSQLDEARSGLHLLLRNGASEADEVDAVCTALDRVAAEIIAAIEDVRLDGAAAAALLRRLADDLERQPHEHEIAHLIATVGNTLADAAAHRNDERQRADRQ